MTFVVTTNPCAESLTLSMLEFEGLILPSDFLTESLAKGEDGLLVLFEPQGEGEN